MKHLYFNPRRGVVSVKLGFCWPAFFFGSLWAMVHHMWVPYALMLLSAELVFGLLLGIAQASHDPAFIAVTLLAGLAMALVRGHLGNRWYAASLRQRGYTESDALLLQP